MRTEFDEQEARQVETIILISILCWAAAVSQILIFHFLQGSTDHRINFHVCMYVSILYCCVNK